MIPIQQKIIDLETAESDDGRTIQAPCPACSMSSRLPFHINEGISGQCIHCDAMLTAKRIDGNIYVNAHVSRRIVTPRNKHNLAVAYEEMAFLYRMMNRFDKVHEALDEATNGIDELLALSPENKGYQILKSLILFRRAEAYQAQGVERQKTRELYQESLALDEKFNNSQDSVLARQLLEQLS